jgi:predicted PurR-regulated permease PerM
MTDQGGTSGQSEYQPQWSTWTRQWMTVALIIAGVYAVTLLRPVIQMLVIAFLVALIMFTPTRAITRRVHMPHALVVVLLYLLLILIVVFILAVIIPAFVNGANNLSHSMDQAYNDLRASLEQYKPEQGIVTILGARLDLGFIIDPIRNFVLGTGGTAPANVDLQQVLSGLFNVAGTLTETVTSTIGVVANFVTTLVMALFISFLILVDLPKTRRSIFNSIPAMYHREYALLISKVGHVWNSFFRGQVIIGVIIGLLTWVQLAVMGVAGAGVLAIFTGVVSLIPTIGGFIALFPLALVPLFQGSSVFSDLPSGAFALLVVGVNLVISQLIWNIVAPKILGDALDLPLPVILVGVFIGAALGGILGAFLIAPILGTLRILVVYAVSKIGQQDPFPGEGAPPMNI